MQSTECNEEILGLTLLTQLHPVFDYHHHRNHQFIVIC